MTEQKFLSPSWTPPDPRPTLEAKRKRGFQQFWGLCVPAGFGAAVIVALLVRSVDVLLPAWAVMTVVIWGAKTGLDKEGV